MRIAIENARKQFGGTAALDGVSLEIAGGEIFFLLGPSGCGKTTLLRAVAGFQDLDSGRILFDGGEMTQVPPHRRNAGMMFQGYALWPHMTVAENIAFGLEERRVGKAERETRVHRVMERVRIAELAGRKPGQLSGGQQQRVALARTLVVEPACLLLDEPLANLDAGLRAEMRREIRDICRESGLTALYVTHDQKEALSCADRLAVMRNGKILQTGTPQELYSRPCSAFVAGFIGEANFIPATVRDADAVSARLETPLGLWTATLPAGAAFHAGQAVQAVVRPAAIRRAAPGGAAPNTFTARVQDAVFLGGQAEYRLAAAGAGLAMQESDPRGMPSPGGELTLHVPPESIVIVER